VKPASFKDLSQQLVNLQYNPELGRQGAYKPNNPIIIRPDSTARWQHVMNAFNAAVKARYENVSFAQPSDDANSE
jgi:biopolymer transport protein ExbD